MPKNQKDPAEASSLQPEILEELKRLRQEKAELQAQLAALQYTADPSASDQDLKTSEHKALLNEAERMTHAGSWTWHLDTNEVSWSDEFFRILGYAPQSVEAGWERFLDAIHPDDRERVFSASKEVMDNIYRAGGASFRVIRPDGTIRYVSGNGAVLTEEDEKPKRLVGTIVDITERHEANLRLQLTEQRLAQAERFEMLGRLSAGISHDFNNIMTVIHAGAELLETQATNLPPQLHEIVRQMKVAALSGRELTARLLNLGKREQLKLDTTSPNAVVRHVVQLMRRLLGPDISIRMALDPDLRPARLDPHLTTQALINLLLNARDAMQPHGGEITIETHLKEESWSITVSDNGPGIPPHMHESIFEPFFTTKAESEGTGLGLSMVREITEKHGGFVRVDSGLHGTSFQLFFPVSPPADRTDSPDSAALPPSLKQPAPQAKRSVLVIEDEDSLALVLKHLLTHEGHRAHITTTAAAALAHYRSHGDKIDLIIADISLPDQGVFSLLETLHGIYPCRHIILLTGGTEPQKLSFESQYAILTKPFTRNELADAIAEATRPYQGP